jgi:hypothetical protein
MRLTGNAVRCAAACKHAGSPEERAFGRRHVSVDIAC